MLKFFLTDYKSIKAVRHLYAILDASGILVSTSTGTYQTLLHCAFSLSGVPQTLKIVHDHVDIIL